MRSVEVPPVMIESASSILQTAAGRYLGPYQLLLQIGRGGMADVFLALAPAETGKARTQVVVKQLLREIVEDDDFRAMLVDEGRLATRLSHPNVVTTFSIEEAGDERFLVMEFLDGQPLSRIRRRAKQQGGVPMAVHLRVLSDVLRGVHYLHELRDESGASLGVVHRDVTPHNIFVTYDGQVKVVDFGIAKAASRLSSTRMGVVKGKLAYLSPESVRGEAMDRRSDVFSVGVMLWEAAVGDRFWADHDELSIFRRLACGDLPLGGPLEKGIDPRILRIIRKAVAIRPEDRFSTAAQMQVELEKLLVSFGEWGSRRLTREHIRTLFADDREVFHEQVHAELVRLDAGKGALTALPLRPRGLAQLPVDAPPLSVTGGSTSRTDLTSGGDLGAATELPLRTWNGPWARALAAVTVLSATALGTLAIRHQVSKSHALASAPAALALSARDPLPVEAPPVAAPPVPFATAALDAGAVAEEGRRTEAGSYDPSVLPARVEPSGVFATGANAGLERADGANAGLERADVGSVVSSELLPETSRDAGAAEFTRVHAITPQDLPRAPEPIAVVSPVRWAPPRRPTATPRASDAVGAVRPRRQLDREDPWSE